MLDRLTDGLSVAELEPLLKAADPAVLLVAPRLLRRIIRRDRDVLHLGWRVPHPRCHVIARETLLSLVEPANLGLDAGTALPSRLILLPRPDAASLAAAPRAVVLQQYWRLLFHARIDCVLQQRILDGKLTESELASRLQRIGSTEFEEIRTVLLQENMLIRSEDDRAAYVEFAAVYLEQRRFAPYLLPLYFPGIQDYETVDAILAADVDTDQLLAATRLPGAADPTAERLPEAEETEGPDTAAEAASATAQPANPELCRRWMQQADHAAQVGNSASAAVLRRRAAVVAEPGQAPGLVEQARADLGRLVDRLQQALQLPADAAKSWRQRLEVLLEPAALGHWPVEARLLYDLQKVCVDHERPPYKLDLVEWTLSLGQQPLRRPLIGQEHVLPLKHLRTALRRLSATRIAGPERRALAELLQTSLHHEEKRLRAHLRPVIGDALDQVGLHPENLPEQVARGKLIEELLDRVISRGFLTMGDLRDALSRNQLKLPDLSGPVEFLHGDPLIRANRNLAGTLDGVFHGGEVYLRWLQRLSAAAFGTRPGRLLTLYVALPFGSSFVLLKGAEEIVHLMAALTGVAIKESESEIAFLQAEPMAAGPKPAEGMAEHTGIHLVNAYSFLLLGLFLLALLHAPRFRQWLGHALTIGWHGLRSVFFDGPAAVLRLPVVQAIRASRPMQLCKQFIGKPLVVAAPLSLLFPLLGAGADTWAMGGGALFLICVILLNSRLGPALEEAIQDWLDRAWEQVGIDFFIGVARFIVGVFKRLVEGFERLMYGVDAWLRFRPGDPRLTVIGKLVLGVAWFFLTYLIRVFINLFVEPTFNPIKHFPIVTVAAKLLVPSIPFLVEVITTSLRPVVGTAIAGLVAGVVIFFIPGFAGFVVWELKENWRLYRANRSRTLRPVLVGSHGETLRRLLRPGFHSGTVPKLFAKLRKAERKSRQSGNWRSFRKQRDALHHVEEAIRHFVEREFLKLLEGSRSWGIEGVSVGAVRPCTNRIQVELCAADGTAASAWLEFIEQTDGLIGRVVEPGWLGGLEEGQRQAFFVALEGLYQLGGVEPKGEPITWEQWVETWTHPSRPPGGRLPPGPQGAGLGQAQRPT